MSQLRRIGVVLTIVALAMVAAPVPANADSNACHPKSWSLDVPHTVQKWKRLRVSWDVDISNCPDYEVLLNDQKAAHKSMLEDTMVADRTFQLKIVKGTKFVRYLSSQEVRVAYLRVGLVTQSTVTKQVRLTEISGNRIMRDAIQEMAREWEDPGEKRLLGVVDWIGYGRDDVTWLRYDPIIRWHRIVNWPTSGAYRFTEQVTFAALDPDVKIVASGAFYGKNKDSVAANGSEQLISRDPEGVLWSTNLAGTGLFDRGPDGKPIPTKGWEIHGVGDFNSDGKDDLLWRRTDGQVAIGYMDRSFRIATAYPGGPDPDLSWKIQAVADFDGDWWDDILWRHKDGALAIWFAGSHLTTGYPTYFNQPNHHATLEWKVIGAADYDEDGKADIFWRRNDGAFAIWRMNGAQMVGDWYPGSIAPEWKFVDFLSHGITAY